MIIIKLFIKKIMQILLDIQIEIGIFHIDEEDFNGIKDVKELATRNICGEFLNIVANNNPFILIGNSDLSSTTKVKYQNGDQYTSKNRLGRNINFGVREFASNAISTGISSYNELRAISSQLKLMQNIKIKKIMNQDKRNKQKFLQYIKSIM